MRSLFAVFAVNLALLAFSASGAGAAEGGSIARFTPANVSQVLATVGATGISPVKASDGTTVIRFVHNGRNYGVIFYVCDSAGTNCAGLNLISIFSGVTYPLGTVNSFNNKYPYGRAHVTNEGKLHSSRYVIADDGLPVKNLVSEFVNFFTITDNLQTHMREANVIALAPGGASPVSFAPPAPQAGVAPSGNHLGSSARVEALIPSNPLPQ